MEKQLAVDEHTTLSLPTISNAIEIFSLVNQYRNDLREFLPWVDETHHVDDTREYIKFCLSQYDNGSALVYLLYYQNKIAGTLSFNTLDKSNDIAKIGYWLASCYQGQGLMTKACAKMIEYGFNGLHLNRIEIHCAINNIKSQNIPIRLNFKKEGELKQGIKLANNQYVDGVIYGLVKEDFNLKLTSPH
ncbi:GNAT family N-acetyltransferase [Piscirickettsia litoralis]|uniref:N-acetyltransferase domain-containing protein n=1 Tax=Piscirickettsia litoralis TaxID=1891921 RepID=A0ABX3A3J9_9GAMM|nr:GNAT family protein [Piscirickettsia litoralis]ODN43023.1 hypothetical protein BGC07_08970 [Piscirickettsia litoralis]